MHTTVGLLIFCSFHFPFLASCHRVEWVPISAGLGYVRIVRIVYPDGGHETRI
jgi:hypothetical protein